ncbi:Mu transposase C-terminal domain-containing protein [Desulfoluna limicola]|nr:Mu transposase C-terminal domain-containing protein [Desulfoluna limicola]
MTHMSIQKTTAPEIAEIMGVARTTISRRAESEGWTYDERTVRGGVQRQYHIAALPTSIRMAIQTYRFKNHLPEVATPNLPVHEMDKACVRLAPAQEAKALAKADLVRLYKGAGEAAAWGRKKEARAIFLESYNTGISHPELFKHLGAVSEPSLKRWERNARNNGLSSLADNRGYWKRGQRAVTDEEGMALLRLALNPNRPRLSEVIRLCRNVMNEMGMPMTRSEDTYRRWINTWKSTNYDTWVFYREGYTAWNDKVAHYIERNYDLLEVGDVLVADGHTLNFETINPFTGKPCRMTMILWYDMKSNFPLGWELMPTENTKAIAAAFRRAVLRLGKLPKVVYLDNGRAFRSRFFKGAPNFDEAGFTGIYSHMNIAVCHAWPYHGQSKTVERFFGTFAEMERRMITYVGTSIVSKPPRMHRGEKLHRRVHEKMTGGMCLSLADTHRAIATWFDEYANRPQGSESRIAGQRPAELFEAGRGPGVNPELLRHMMMAEKITAITRHGIRFLNRKYYHPELYGRTHSAIIRYDLQNPELIYVYDADGQFLCEASEKVKVHPMATYLGTEEDRKEVAGQIELKQSLAKQTTSSARQFLESEVMPETRRQLERQGIHLTNLPEERKKLAAPAPMTDEERDQILKDVEDLEALNAEPEPTVEEEVYVPEVEDESAREWMLIEKMSDMDRMYKLLEFEVKGVMMPAKWQAWMKYYEETVEFKTYKGHFTDHRNQMALVYGHEAAL